jgi:hypothetical protein
MSRAEPYHWYDSVTKEEACLKTRVFRELPGWATEAPSSRGAWSDSVFGQFHSELFAFVRRTFTEVEESSDQATAFMCSIFHLSSWGHCGLWRLKSRPGVILQQTAGMSIVVLFLGLHLNFSAAKHSTVQNMEEGLIIKERVGSDQVYVLRLGWPGFVQVGSCGLCPMGDTLAAVESWT